MSLEAERKEQESYEALVREVWPKTHKVNWLTVPFSSILSAMVFGPNREWLRLLPRIWQERSKVLDPPGLSDAANVMYRCAESIKEYPELLDTMWSMWAMIWKSYGYYRKAIQSVIRSMLELDRHDWESFVFSDHGKHLKPLRDLVKKTGPEWTPDFPENSLLGFKQALWYGCFTEAKRLYHHAPSKHPPMNYPWLITDNGKNDHPIFYAILGGNLEAVQWVVENSTFPDNVPYNKKEYTPVMLAAEENQLEILQWLVMEYKPFGGAKQLFERHNWACDDRNVLKLTSSPACWLWMLTLPESALFCVDCPGSAIYVCGELSTTVEGYGRLSLDFRGRNLCNGTCKLLAGGISPSFRFADLTNNPRIGLPGIQQLFRIPREPNITGSRPHAVMRVPIPDLKTYNYLQCCKFSKDHVRYSFPTLRDVAAARLVEISSKFGPSGEWVSPSGKHRAIPKELHALLQAKIDGQQPVLKSPDEEAMYAEIDRINARYQEEQEDEDMYIEVDLALEPQLMNDENPTSRLSSDADEQVADPLTSWELCRKRKRRRSRRKGTKRSRKGRKRARVR